MTKPDIHPCPLCGCRGQHLRGQHLEELISIRAELDQIKATLREIAERPSELESGIDDQA